MDNTNKGCSQPLFLWLSQGLSTIAANVQVKQSLREEKDPVQIHTVNNWDTSDVPSPLQLMNPGLALTLTSNYKMLLPLY